MKRVCCQKMARKFLPRGQRIEFFLGLATVFLVLGAMWVLTAPRRALHSGYPIFAHFQQVDGISQGSEVRIGGIKMGSVESISIDSKTYAARVMMHIQSDIRIPADSSVQVNSDGFIGAKFLAIIPGGAAKFLNPGDRVRSTRSSVSLENLLSQLIFNMGQKSSAHPSS